MNKDQLKRANEINERIKSIDYTISQLNQAIEQFNPSEIFLTIGTKKEYSLIIYESQFNGFDLDNICKFLKGILLSELEPLKKEFESL
jgi:hypothetical protein